MTSQSANTRVARSSGFPPVIGNDPKVLILGSLPGRRSLSENQYYAHPQNAFWRVMYETLELSRDASYESRCNALIASSIALWDVLASSVRPGSLDSAIVSSSARANDFASLFARHHGIKLIGFNGYKARHLFDRMVYRSISMPDECELVTLPSTSAANAAMSYEEKLERWSVVSQYLVLEDPAEA